MSDDNEVGLLQEGGEQQQPVHSEEIQNRLKQIKVNKIKPLADDEGLQDTPHNIGEIICLFFLNLIVFIILPLYLSLCWIVISPNEAVIVSSFGKVRKVIHEPGCHYTPLLARQSISTKVETMTIAGSSVPDLKGSPMNVSVIVNYKIVDPIRAVYAVDDYKGYLYN